jgi:hypothetical protein
LVRATAPHLGLRVELDVRFQSDDGFVFHCGKSLTKTPRSETWIFQDTFNLGGELGHATIWSPSNSVAIQAFNLQKAVQLPQTRGMAHFAERLGLDLPDPFARDIELVANFLKRARVAVAQAKA